MNAKAGIKSECLRPPKLAAQAPKQHKPKAQLVVAPKEEPHFEAKNAFDLLAIDDEGATMTTTTTRRRRRTTRRGDERRRVRNGQSERSTRTGREAEEGGGT